MRPAALGWAPALAWLAVLVLAASPRPAESGSFIFTDDLGLPESITHPPGYGGGGTLDVSLCIDPSSSNVDEMELPLQQVIDVWNGLVPTTGNLVSGGANNVPAGRVDFTSVLLHEVGHCIGLAHPNAATESGLARADQNYTKALPGPNASFDLNDGPDNRKGSADDLRGDDINIHWFEIGVNDPFTLAAGVIDASTHSVDLADLPAGDSFAANADRSVGSLLGFPDSEAVMQQETFTDEAQRSLGADDVATLRIGMSGLDENQGNSDDYSIQLSYAGRTTSCDIVVEFQADPGASAFCQTTGQQLRRFFTFGSLTDHAVIVDANIVFSEQVNWYFPPLCADGALDLGESCDDGNQTSGDGCDLSCQAEPGFVCSGQPSVCSGVCGDGSVVSGEGCDDGNTAPGDGCSDTCQVETGFVCSGIPSTCDGLCGDGLVVGSETCDDGETVAGDGCSVLCQEEPGYQCTGEPSTCSEVCGDGFAIGGEGCDDGNTAPGDGCSETCQVETGFVCSGIPSTCSEVCGDGIVTPGEGCDDGNTAPGDGCSAVCTVEPGSTCTGEPSECTPPTIPALGPWARGLLALCLLVASACRASRPRPAGSA